MRDERTTVRSSAAQFRRLALILVAITSPFAAAPAGAEEASTSNYRSLGYDISWPQCGESYPVTPMGHAVVGVNGGRAFTRNLCLRSQWRWARAAMEEPAVYINLNMPGVPAVPSTSGPAGFCESHNPYCRAHNFGYAAARHAVAYARSQGVASSTYWLDVETMNAWSEDTVENAQVIQGALNYLEQQGFRVGVYSTPYQWTVIAGGYSPGLPVWTAGAVDFADARSRCHADYAFGGGAVVMVQWVDGFDRNWVCTPPEPRGFERLRPPTGNR
ncbi:hypothetical protein AYO38_04940 [bacterium SCGC AG-212-C10]|nr:hypothetical protein AYO38_04940 [bacterium SCGC AG-212-C10]